MQTYKEILEDTVGGHNQRWMKAAPLNLFKTKVYTAQTMTVVPFLMFFLATHIYLKLHMKYNRFQMFKGLSKRKRNSIGQELRY